MASHSSTSDQRLGLFPFEGDGSAGDCGLGTIDGELVVSRFDGGKRFTGRNPTAGHQPRVDLDDPAGDLGNDLDGGLGVDLPVTLDDRRHIG